ncbi:methylmalonyl-CoA mutase family protein [Jeotgalibacillus terrae]|uniref:Methylmalonyl-CoA mutase family protein n=1 Tax=Jeotgalibacillus terrae TaxID=587735 RepID=A0ABW5ZKT1_9BACL|nr:methylmalonyl-CoA mutase family protein [Jeotgalibacillus terrae]MBM7577525.1 methylmalonyl-CoA mutase [Jeotgalibacillus terrae]
MNNKTVFPAASYEEWIEQVEKVLKGKPVDSLNKMTPEGITLHPLYTDRPETDDSHISRYWKPNPDWLIAQQAFGLQASKLISAAREELTRGSDIVALDSETSGCFNAQDAVSLFSLKDELHIYIKHQDGNPWIQALSDRKVRGVLGRDWGSQVQNNTTDEAFTEMKEIDQTHPELKSVILSSISIHQKGANMIQELAFILSQASSVIRKADHHGWAIDKICSKIHVEFAIGSDFFMEISKLRAFRALWHHFMSQYGVTHTVTIGAETAQFTKLTQDEHTNMLRSGNEAFAAVLGGADYISAKPYDWFKQKPSQQAIRAARNILLILKEEMFLQNQIDPAGGSYYVEHLTKEIAEKAWEQFCEIEDNKGIEHVYSEFMNEIKTVFDKRDQDVRTRKQSLVGLNKYAPPEKNILKHIPETAGYSWDLLIQKVKTTSTASVSLYPVGELKDYKPRADFVKGVFSAAGIVPDINNNEAQVIIVCGSDKAYEEYLFGVIQSKKAGQKVFAAGKYEARGLDGVIYSGMDMISFLEEVLFGQKGANGHEA